MQVQCKTIKHMLHIDPPRIVPANSIPLWESEERSSSVKERWSRKALMEAKWDAKYPAALVAVCQT